MASAFANAFLYSVLNFCAQCTGAMSRRLILLVITAVVVFTEAGAGPVEDAGVLSLTSATFGSVSGRWYIEFYAPVGDALRGAWSCRPEDCHAAMLLQWCGHCTQFAPTYADAAIALSGRVRFGKVDGSSEKGARAAVRVVSPLAAAVHSFRLHVWRRSPDVLLRVVSRRVNGSISCDRVSDRVPAPRGWLRVRRPPHVWRVCRRAVSVPAQVSVLGSTNIGWFAVVCAGWLCERAWLVPRTKVKVRRQLTPRCARV